MSIQKLFAVLVVFALLFAPAFTRAGESYAAVPDHHAQMLMKGHCESPPDSEGKKSADKSCCFQMCMAVAAEPAAPLAPQALLPGAKTPALQSFPIGTPAELATPPPRAA